MKYIGRTLLSYVRRIVYDQSTIGCTLFDWFFVVNNPSYGHDDRKGKKRVLRKTIKLRSFFRISKQYMQYKKLWNGNSKARIQRGGKLARQVRRPLALLVARTPSVIKELRWRPPYMLLNSETSKRTVKNWTNFTKFASRGIQALIYIRWVTTARKFEGAKKMYRNFFGFVRGIVALFHEKIGCSRWTVIKTKGIDVDADSWAISLYLLVRSYRSSTTGIHVPRGRFGMIIGLALGKKAWYIIKTFGNLDPIWQNA